jgi:aminoglycoside phosphotransferase (APT) family kinase protein
VTVNDELEGRLLDVLRARTGKPELNYAGPPVPLHGGFWAELVAFSLTDPPPGWPADLVARVMPDAWFARKETIVQAGMAAAGFPTPAVRAAGGPDDGVGRAFMVMDRADGSPLLSGLEGIGAIVTVLRTAGRLPEVLASTMARLHAIDPQPIRDQLDREGDEAPSTVDGLLGMLERLAAGFQRADLAAAARWLLEHPPPPAADVVCHGDLHPFNLLVSDKRVTVLDWSNCMLAPRTHDVAFTSLMLAEPSIAVPAPLRPLLRSAGRLLARRFIRRYERNAQVTVAPAELAWHRAVVCLRALTEVASWVHHGVVADHESHPWLVIGQVTAARLSAVTGIEVRPR